MEISSSSTIYWNRKIPDTQLEKFQKIIENKYNVKFETYWELHKWTVDNNVKFWEEMWNFFEIVASEPYREVFVKTGPGFLDCEWFVGAKLNFAENVFRIRDDRLALIYMDEMGNEEMVSYSEMFEQVKLYAAAFRKNGLKIGDRVACYMSNRKEAIFAFLAVASIGALWGGPIAFYGPKPSSNMLNKMEPKFLISIDMHYMDGICCRNVDYLPEIIDSVPMIKKVILVVTHEEIRQKSLSSIPKCITLDEFLAEGRISDGKVPDIIFEQLSFNHPLFINFTSGTTGSPKTAVHSAGTMISNMRDYAISYNLKKGDLVCSLYSAGWSTWDDFAPCLNAGLPIFLYHGSVINTLNGLNLWDFVAKYKVKMILLIPSMIDLMEKNHITPSDSSDMSHLEKVILTGIPAKKENFEYLLNKVKRDLFVGSIYGSTEAFGNFSGFNINMPIYGAEIQAPALGIDLQCYDSKGNSVVGERGELVICKPSVNFLTGLWKDSDKTKLTKIYLSKFPGVWQQHDICWINPETKGIIVIGRSDDELKQLGERFSPSDIYSAIHSMDEIQDYICVSQGRSNGDCRAVLFVKMKNGCKLTTAIRSKITKSIEDELIEECVPELILEVPAIPYNVNNKRVESLVKTIINSNNIPEEVNIRNPESLEHFINIPEVISYDQQCSVYQNGY